MKKDIVHYNLDRIQEKDCDINLILGERSNGKSYQVKHKRAILNYISSLANINDLPTYFKQGKRFMLVRRLKEEITNEKVLQYFQDVDIEKITNGKYNCINVYRRHIYLANLLDDGKIKNGEMIGYCVALSTEQNYAGGSFLDVSDIIFEEVISRTTYLYKESSKLMNLYATVDRKRHTTKLWMVGNTISRVCPYLYDWGLYDTILKMKQGDIKVVEIPSTDGDVVKVAIEWCKSTGVSSHTIGASKGMMSSGEWETTQQPHLPKSYKEYKVEFRLIFMYQQFKYIGELLIDKETHNIAWYIYSYDGEIDNKTLVITDRINTSPYYQRDIYNLSIGDENLKRIINTTFREQNIFYATDLIGSEFKQVIDFVIRR